MVSNKDGHALGVVYSPWLQEGDDLDERGHCKLNLTSESSRCEQD